MVVAPSRRRSSTQACISPLHFLAVVFVLSLSVSLLLRGVGIE